MSRFAGPLVVGLLSSFLYGAEPPLAPRSSPPQPSLEQLIQRLGDSAFKVRDEAQKALEQVGAEALPRLREQAKNSPDPEIRRRLTELIPALERNAALAPTTVTLTAKDRPVRDLIRELSTKSGYRIELQSTASVGDERERRLVSIDCHEAPFWEVLDRLCELGGLTFQDNWYGAENVQIRLQFGESYPGYASIQGPFRVTARSFYHNKNLELMTGTRTNADSPFRRSETLHLNVGVTVEPKLSVLSASQPNVLEAMDDQGQSMIMPSPASRPGGGQEHFHNGYGASIMHIQVPLLPSAMGKRIKVLKGNIPVTLVASQKPKITVEKLLEVKNKSFKEGGTSLTIDEVTRSGNNVTVKLNLTEAGTKGINNYAMMNSVMRRLELIDARGVKYRCYGNSWSTSDTNVQGTFTFTPEPTRSTPAVGLAAILGRPNQGPQNPKLVYYEWTTITHPVPFEFRDLPLP